MYNNYITDADSTLLKFSNTTLFSPKDKALLNYFDIYKVIHAQYLYILLSLQKYRTYHSLSYNDLRQYLFSKNCKHSTFYSQINKNFNSLQTFSRAERKSFKIFSQIQHSSAFKKSLLLWSPSIFSLARTLSLHRVERTCVTYASSSKTQKKLQEELCSLLPPQYSFSLVLSQ